MLSTPYYSFQSLKNNRGLKFLPTCDLSSKESYLEWVKTWKYDYSIISKYLRELKKDRKPSKLRNCSFFLDEVRKRHKLTFRQHPSKEQIEEHLPFYRGMRQLELIQVKELARSYLRMRQNMKYASAFKRLDNKIG